MTNLYFLKIFFIDKIIPYTLMTLSIAYLLLEIIAPRHLRAVFYDFSDRLFFKFIYRPINKFIGLLKRIFIFNLKKVQTLLNFNEKIKLKKIKKREEKQLIKKEKKEQSMIIKAQKKEEKLQNKLENRKLKAEMKYKIKIFMAYKVKNIINKLQSK